MNHNLDKLNIMYDKLIEKLTQMHQEKIKIDKINSNYELLLQENKLLDPRFSLPYFMVQKEFWLPHSIEE